MRLKKVKETVKAILIEDERARGDDHYLFTLVVAKYCPALTHGDFTETMRKLNGVVSFESVRRSRAKVQVENPELRPDPDTDAARMVKESEYKEFAING